MENDNEQDNPNPKSIAYFSTLDHFIRRRGGVRIVDSTEATAGTFQGVKHVLPQLTAEQWKARRVAAKERRAAKEAARMAHAQD
jgi:hypothetical protein